MANFQLASDTILNIPIQAKDANGVLTALPAGDQFTVVASDPTILNAVIGIDATGGKAVILNGLKLGVNVTVTLTDTAGLQPFTLQVDVVTNIATGGAPTMLFLDPTTGVATKQAAVG